MRLRRIPGTKEVLAGYPDLVIDEPSKYRGKWQQFFDNAHPIHLEIGMGRGKFLTALAAQNPHYNYLGVEFREEMIHKAIQRLGNYRHNIAFLWYNALNISEVFSQGEISSIYLNFSDPWPKKRHEKRRLTHRNFLSQYKCFLRPGGTVIFKTDNQDFFEFSLNEFADNGYFLKNITFDLHHSNLKGNIITEYEEKYSKIKPIYRCEACLI
ncbi:MAG: tRNA (guanosine(46)-N7)-methyltransferase TrmB [Bacillota bacterium]|jgi:tRNA (guanine-N7-)-methyltransferase